MPKRDFADRLHTVDLRDMFQVPSIETRLRQAGLRWAGHVARGSDARIPKMMMGARRAGEGRGAAGCRRPSLLGVTGTSGPFGAKGHYMGCVDAALDGAARRRHFGGARGHWNQ